MQPGMHTQQHTGRVSRFGKDAVHIIAKRQFQAECHAAGTAAHAARQIDKQRVLRVHCDARVRKLALQPAACHRIAEKQVAGVFIVDKKAAWILRGLVSALFHGDAIILCVFHHRYAMRTQQRFFPFTRVRRHMHADLKAQFCRGDADG